TPDSTRTSRTSGTSTPIDARTSPPIRPRAPPSSPSPWPSDMPTQTHTRSPILSHARRAMSIRHVALALAALVVGACDLPNVPNLNNPSVTDFSTIADLPHLQALVTGVLRGDRVQNENEIIYGETLGRDAI